MTWEQRTYSTQPAFVLDRRRGAGIDESRQEHWIGSRRCASREACRPGLEPQPAELLRKRRVGHTAWVTGMRCRPDTRQVGDDGTVLHDLPFGRRGICGDSVPMGMQLHVH